MRRLLVRSTSGPQADVERPEEGEGKSSKASSVSRDSIRDRFMLAKRLLVIDVETTGLDPASDSIVQLAACTLARKDLHVEDTFVSYVRPQSKISAEARGVHGLSEDDLRDAPSVREVVKKFSEFAPEDVVLCGHNVAFDAGFLRAAYKRARLPYGFDYHTVDLWSIAFFILGAQKISLETYDLKSLCGLYGIGRSKRHDALEDVLATAGVLRHLFDAVRHESLNVLGQFDLFSRR